MDKTKKRNNIKDMVLAAICLALALLLPFLTGQLPQLGSMISPMHIPVLLCGFIAGPWWGLAVGAVAPLLRSAIFGMPPMFPTAAAMAFELAAYGLVAGLMYRALRKSVPNIYVSLITAMIVGRIVWGIAMMLMMTASGGSFTFAAWMAGAFTNAIPAIVIHIVLIPLLVMALRKARITD